ncbi:hypothetical protein LDENG_00129120 [Lucifuga dentata]|nr:hypothetical protein LDENG_00129120 [Lucifuga dentata]
MLVCDNRLLLQQHSTRFSSVIGNYQETTNVQLHPAATGKRSNRVNTGIRYEPLKKENMLYFLMAWEASWTSLQQQTSNRRSSCDVFVSQALKRPLLFPTIPQRPPSRSVPLRPARMRSPLIWLFLAVTDSSVTTVT